nr:polysaccharide biosynthesis/export family protein [Bryobacteraceae bacterium]
MRNLFGFMKLPLPFGGGVANALCLLLLLLPLFAAPGSAQTTSQRNQSRSAAESSNAESKPAEPITANLRAPGATAGTKTFKVGPEDILRIIVWREPDFTGLYTVHSDGKITLPLVGDLQAGGLTAEQIQKNVTDALSKLIQKPNVTVTVQQILSQKYYMDGLVNRPGEYHLTAPTTILEAISIAGGLREFASEKKIYVLRGDQRIPFNYKQVIKGKNLAQNIQLQSGDHVIVP